MSHHHDTSSRRTRTVTSCPFHSLLVFCLAFHALHCIDEIVCKLRWEEELAFSGRICFWGRAFREMGWLCFSFVFFFPRCLNSSHFQKNNFGKGFFWEWFGVFFQVLKVFPFPITITNLQFAVGGVIVLLMWVTGLHKKPSSISRNQVCTQKPFSQQTRTTKEQAALNSSAGTRSGCSRVFCKKSVQ